jgi:hypothetical protein
MAAIENGQEFVWDRVIFTEITQGGKKKRFKESESEFLAFTCYRDIPYTIPGIRRTHRVAKYLYDGGKPELVPLDVQEQTKLIGTAYGSAFANWSSKFQWAERVLAFDDYVDKQRQLRTIDAACKVHEAVLGKASELANTVLNAALGIQAPRLANMQGSTLKFTAKEQIKALEIALKMLTDATGKPAPSQAQSLTVASVSDTGAVSSEDILSAIKMLASIPNGAK